MKMNIFYHKIPIVSTLLLMSILLLSCEPEKNKVERTAAEYLQAILDRDVQKMESMQTPETNNYPKPCTLQVYEFRDVKEVKNVSCIVKKDVANCTFCCSEDPLNNQLMLLKQEGKWLVHIPKETPPVPDTTAVSE